MSASHAAALSNATADHVKEVQNVKEELSGLRLAVEAGSRSVEEAVRGRQEAEDNGAKVMADLEAARKEIEELRSAPVNESEKESGEEEKRLRKVIEDLRDEMNGTKMVSRAVLFTHSPRTPLTLPPTPKP